MPIIFLRCPAVSPVPPNRISAAGCVTLGSTVCRQVEAAAESDQAAALMEIAEATDGGCVQLPQHAEQLFSLETGAQLFFVAPDGAVSAPTAPHELRVCRFPGQPARAPWRVEEVAIRILFCLGLPARETKSQKGHEACRGG